LPRLSVTLRDARGEDGEFLFQLFSSTREEELAAVPWTEEEKEVFLRMQFDAQTRHYSAAFPHMDYKIILVDDNRAGRVLTTRLPGDLHVIDIAISPSCRNLGIGTMLIRKLKSDAERENLVLSLYVEVYNRARILYERLGFVEVSTDNIYTRMEYRPGKILQDEIHSESNMSRRETEITR